MSLYHVCWKSLRTGTTGHSEPMPRYLAEFLVEYRDRAEPNLKHWVEEAIATA